MSEHDSLLLLEYEDFISDKRTVDAVVRNFGNIGEAVNCLNVEFKEQHSDIEWNRIQGFRNRIVHEYFGIDYRIVWTIIESCLDEFQVLSYNEKFRFLGR